MVKKCTWTSRPVSAELASCFFSKRMWLQVIPYVINHIFLPCFILWEPKKWLLSTAVFIECVSTAEITACITSLLSTCHHFAGKQPAECKGRDSLLVLAKHLQLTNCRICGQTSGSFSQRQPSETFFALYSETRDERPPENETNQLWT